MLQIFCGCEYLRFEFTEGNVYVIVAMVWFCYFNCCMCFVKLFFNYSANDNLSLTMVIYTLTLSY